MFTLQPLIRNMQEVKNQEIIHYYETCDEHYSLLWHLNTHMAMHYGYWDKNTRNLKDALFNLNELLANEAGIDASTKVLDAGCGVGGSSLYLARTRKCQVEGITLSSKHVALANTQSQKEGLAELAHFSVNDFTSTNFEPETFDVVWAIESVCHANEKKEFLAEAFRVLKKGGKLIMVDFYRTMPEPNEKEFYWLNSWAKTWAVPHFEYKDHFLQKAKEVGFSSVQAKDITPNIKPSARLLYFYFFPGMAWNYLLKLVGKHNNSHIENIWSAYYQYHALQKGFWSYELISAAKA
ncbi:MAG: SAM-dependent methyltransferase [Bacteroidetes bacterium B1(2017)]|nr:MAG: SAM-dependent methyltransferase [Bacteroidetes bacterium B1(2017)]